MTKWPLIALIVAGSFSIVGCNAAEPGKSGLFGLISGASAAEPPPKPTITVFRRQALYNGHGIALSVMGADIDPRDLELMAAKERRSLVRVFVYGPDQTVATDRPAAFFEHTETGGFKQIY
jgi:hypothetical protein